MLSWAEAQQEQGFGISILHDTYKGHLLHIIMKEELLYSLLLNSS
jgi:hypothetical protein